MPRFNFPVEVYEGEKFIRIRKATAACANPFDPSEEGHAELCLKAMQAASKVCKKPVDEKMIWRVDGVKEGEGVWSLNVNRFGGPSLHYIPKVRTIQSGKAKVKGRVFGLPE